MKRPYRRLCDASDPRWLDLRAGLITASEMALVLGEAPKWFKKSLDDLANEKRSGARDDFEPTRRMLWGSRCEKRNLEDCRDLLGIQARHTNVLLQSTRCEYIGATLDGLCRIPRFPRPYLFPEYTGSQAHADELAEEIQQRRGQFGLLEMKQTGFLGDWKAGVPDYYLTQLQTQLYVTGLDWGLICAKVGADDMRAYFVDADPFLHDEMEEAVNTFWRTRVAA